MMQDDFLEPLPSAQMEATLLFGATPVRCSMIEVTAEGFRVGVPGARRFQGEPEMKLATADEIYSVRLVQQDAHTDGCSLWLTWTGDVRPASHLMNQFKGWKRITLRSWISIAIVGMAFSYFVIPRFHNRIPLCWEPAIQIVGIETSESNAADKTASWSNLTPDIHLSELAVPQKTENEDPNPEAKSVSMISPASLTTDGSANRPNSNPVSRNAISNGERRTAATQKPISLGRLLAEGQVGRIRDVTKPLVPWLFESIQSDQSFAIRMSDAAASDLKQFEIDLHDLPPQATAEAIAKLRETMQFTNVDVRKLRRVAGTSDVYVVDSEDARIYFKIVRQRMELVRVLPIDYFEKD